MQIRRRSRRLLALMLGLQLLVGAGGLLAIGPGAARAVETRHVKVVIVVGPVGRLSDYYRGLADEAAAAARNQTDDVVTVYTPDATWPAVRRALDGASIVVYLGHGNGWPSPYRNALYRTTQNGLGLNPVAGVDDSAHQYFGERYLARDVRLAPGAVVILGHLCYASGDPEPGGPTPTLDVARQRVDNYAAGWLAAGASAVVAEGHGRPAHYVTALLEGRGTIEQMWRSAPTFHDHVIESPSARTPGAAVMLDPDRVARGYFRALTVLPGARIVDTLAGARSRPATPAGRTAAPEPPSLADRGARFAAPQLDGRTVAASDAALTIAVDGATLELLPEDVSIGTRWDPLTPAAPGRPDPSSAGSSSSPPSTAPDLRTDPTAGATTAAAAAAAAVSSASTGPSAAAPQSDDPPTIELIGAEVPGEEVVVAPSARSPAGLTIPVRLPAEPGLYRLVTSLHDGHGVAFDAETQDLIPALIVRVTALTSATYGVPTEVATSAGAGLRIRVRVANTGSTPWRQGIAPEPLGGPPAAGDYEAVVGADTPAAYWRLGEPSGPFVDTMVGNDLAAIGSPTRAIANTSLAADDGAIAFPTEGDYLAARDAKALDLGDGPFSIEFWFRRDTDSGDQVSILNKGTNGYSIAILANDRLSLGKVGVANLVSESGTTPADGTWHHFVVTRSGAGVGRTRWYKDGVEGHIDLDATTRLANTTADLEIGREGETVPGGALDELAIYKSVLPADRVATHAALRSFAAPVAAGTTGATHGVSPRRPTDSSRAPRLVVRWVGLDDADAASDSAPNGTVEAPIDPGQEAVLDVDLAAPSQPGRYLLVFDLQTQDGLSLASLGVAPGITRVIVGLPSQGEEPPRPAPGAAGAG